MHTKIPSLVIVLLHLVCQVGGQEPLSDSHVDKVVSDLSLEEAMEGSYAPDTIQKSLALIAVRYWDMDSVSCVGQLVVDAELKNEVKEIFGEIYNSGFPIESIIPISRFDWSDEESMKANNTSCFNYRTVAGQRFLSDHAFGRAIDINPAQNPYVRYPDGDTLPEGASYNPHEPGALTSGSVPVEAFTKRGWKWGGNWRYTRDYQHFYKR